MSGRRNIPETKNGMSAVRFNNSGFTLIEIVVALLVLTIGLLGMAGLSIEVMKGNKSSNQISTATALVQDKMEKLRELGYENLPAPNSTVTEDYGSIRINENEDEDPPLEFKHYKRIVSLLPNETIHLYSDGTKSYDNDIIAGKNLITSTKTVTVRVHWNPQDDTRNYVETKMLFSR